jgi:hypothetical protein
MFLFQMWGKARRGKCSGGNGAFQETASSNGHATLRSEMKKASRARRTGGRRRGFFANAFYERP